MKWVLRIVAVVVAIPLVGAAVLLAMGQRSGAGRIGASTEVQAAPEQIWPWFDESAKLKQWVSWLVDVREGGNPVSGLGAKRVWVMRDENNGGMLMEIEAMYTEYTPPVRLAVHTRTADMFDGQQAYRLTDLGNGRTRVDAEGTYQFHIWFARLMEPVITPQASQKMRGDLARLKGLVEKNVTGAASAH